MTEFLILIAGTLFIFCGIFIGVNFAENKLKTYGLIKYDTTTGEEIKAIRCSKIEWPKEQRK